MNRRHPPWEEDRAKWFAGESGPQSSAKQGLNVLSAGEEYDDYYAMNYDHQGQPAPWRIGEHTDAGALNDDQVTDIARRFGFETEDVRRLSICVGWALERLNPMRNVPARRIPVPWTKKHPEGTPELLHYLRASYDAQAEAVAWLRKACCEAEQSDDCECWHCVERRRIDELMEQARLQYRRVAPHWEAPMRLWDLKPIDRRNLPDNRRIAVTYELFLFWWQFDRSLATTVNPVTSSREGRLVDFVNAVVSCVTEPSSALPPQTIFNDLQKWKDDVDQQEREQESEKRRSMPLEFDGHDRVDALPGLRGSCPLPR